MPMQNPSLPLDEQAPAARASQPIWWTVQHTAIWEVAEPSLRREYERKRAERQRAEMKALGPDDTLLGATDETPRNVDVDHAVDVSDDGWELHDDWDAVQPALRLGVGASHQYADVPTWNDSLEQLLRKDWGRSHDPSAWEKLKRAVRRGFEFGRGD